MAFVRLIWKAGKIKKLQTQLAEEKQKAIEFTKNKTAKYSWRQKYRHFWLDLLYCIPNCFRKYCICPEKSCMYRTIYKAKRDGTCENFAIKSIVGFIGGFFITYIFFMFFVFQLNFKLSSATIMCSIFGSILTIGLSFSYKVRCVVFLLLPQFFSKRGRQALIAYAFILAITGPAKNILHNVGILSESMACGQEQLKSAVRQILEVIKKPFYAIRDAIKSVVKTVKEIVKKIKEVLLTIKRIIMGILKVIKAAFEFLGKMLNVCNKELGTPFERCTKVFEDAIVDCNAKLGPLFNWLCSITSLVQGVCYIVKMFDFICMLVEYISDSVIGVVIRKVKIFVRHIRTMFYVRIKFSHSFHFETNQSKPINEITTGIVTEIRHRTERLLTVLDIMSCATSLFFLFIILKAMHYRYKFLTIDRFDNRYITKHFREIDMRRAQLEKQTILPLNHRERTLYISVNSLRLVDVERVQLSKQAVGLGTTTLKLFSHMMMDYSLYWIMTVIRYHSAYQTSVPVPNMAQINVAGQGFLASLLKSIVKAFQPLGVDFEIDTIPCLPDPIPPDYDRYIQIVTLLLLCWILTIFEPYGLRLRHSIMAFYHPTRARQRSIWLYNHVMRSRSSFLKFARRQLRRKFSKSNKITKITFIEYLRANIRPTFLVMCLGSGNEITCMLCGEVFRNSESVKPIYCSNPGCLGIYCEQCFADLQNKCTICMAPIEYGDMSDISVEQDSSEDERPSEKTNKNKKKKTWYISSCFKKRRSDKDDDYDDDNALINLSDSSDVEKFESDYYSSDTSSDNSYTYQYNKDYTDVIVTSTSTHFSDIEKQTVRDEVSWGTFNRDLGKYNNSLSDSETTTSSIISGINNSVLKRKKGTGSNKYNKKNYSDKTATSTSTHSSRSDQTSAETTISLSLNSETELINVDLIPKNEEDTDSEVELISIDLTKQTQTSRHVLFNSKLDTQTDLTSSSSSSKMTPLKPKLIDNYRVQYVGPDRVFAKNARTSTTETSFIETPKTSEIKENNKFTTYQNVLRLPRLNFSFSSSETSSPGRRELLSVLERFRKDVKYESIKETSKFERTSATPKRSPKSPLRIGYEIYVPRFDKFVDCTEAMNVKRGENEIKSQFEKNVDLLKHLQRKERVEDIQKRLSKNKLPSEKDKESFGSGSKRTPPYTLRVKDYYKSINKGQPLESVPILKKNNRFIRLMKNLFLKEKIELPQPRVQFTSNKYVNVSPKSSEQDRGTTIQLTSTNSTSLERSIASTTSSTTSLMGTTLTISHQRGGADVELRNKKVSTTDDNITNFDDYESTDSDITDVSVFFGSSVPEEFKRNKIHKKDSETGSTSVDSSHNTNDSSHVKNLVKEEAIPRYSRQPAERDENPASRDEEYRPTKLFTNNQDLPSSEINLTMTNEMQSNYCHSDITTPLIENLRNQYRVNSNKPEHKHEHCNCQFHCRQRQRPLSRSSQENRSSHYPTQCNRNPRHSDIHEINPNPRYASAATSTQASEFCCCQHSPPRSRKISPCSSDFSDDNKSSVSQPCKRRNYKTRSDCGNDRHHHKKECPCNQLQISVPAQQNEEGGCSDGSGGSDFPHLVYQNTNEFLELVNELGDTLSLRNKQRVQKAIREFEVNSRQNKNLERPVFTDDSDDSGQKCAKGKCCQCNKKKLVPPIECPTKFTRISTRKENIGKSVPFQSQCLQGETHYTKFPVHDKPSCPKYQQNISSTHWELDPRTGEWYKIYNDYSYEDDFYLNLPVSPPPMRQFCTCEKGYRRMSRRDSADKHFRSNFVLPSSTCKCNNCGCARKEREESEERF